jgi:hypothetical protein
LQKYFPGTEEKNRNFGNNPPKLAKQGAKQASCGHFPKETSGGEGCGAAKADIPAADLKTDKKPPVKGRKHEDEVRKRGVFWSQRP